MIYRTLLLLIGITVGFVVATLVFWGFKYRDIRDEEGKKLDFWSRGIVARQMERKSRNLNKILELLRERGELSNSQIRQSLRVSDRTAVRYMDELEKEGKVEQKGNIGQSVVYHLKK